MMGTFSFFIKDLNILFPHRYPDNAISMALFKCTTIHSCTKYCVPMRMRKYTIIIIIVAIIMNGIYTRHEIQRGWGNARHHFLEGGPMSAQSVLFLFVINSSFLLLVLLAFLFQINANFCGMPILAILRCSMKKKLSPNRFMLSQICITLCLFLFSLNQKYKHWLKVKAVIHIF